MQKYEIMYIIKPLEEEEIYQVTSSINQMLEMNDTQIIKEDLWGKKKLCYDVEEMLGLTEGFYVLLTLNTEPSTIRKIDQKLRTTDEIIRHMIISCGE